MIILANRNRNIQIHFYVTAEERGLIEEKMAKVPTNKMGSYLRKMAIDGYVIHNDTTNIKNMNEELRKIGVNINQIARRLNTMDNIYAEDISELKEGLDKIWQLQRTILLTLH